MRYAIVSDIHANLPAWSAVLDDIAREGVDGICCLGDIVGYGPRPRAVLASVRQHCENVVLGNHDAVVAGKLQPSEFNLAAREAIEWTRERLGEDGQAYFAGVPLTLRGDGILLTHGDAAQPAKFCYVTKPEQARASFKASKRDILFFGHTHQPGVMSCSGPRETINKLPPRDMILKPGTRYMINPGSVGDPRCSSDLRASYCLFDSKTLQLRFRRLEFDVDEYRRDFAASGLRHKPFFLRVLDAESVREGVVADHRQSVDAGIAEDRGARLRVGGAPVSANWNHSQTLAPAQVAKRCRRRSKIGLLFAAILLLAGAAVAALFWPTTGIPPLVERDAIPTQRGDTEPVRPSGARHVTPVSTEGAAQPGLDHELIMTDESWEDPNEGRN